MAAGGQMAEFFATLGIKIDKADIVKVDKTLDHIENRAKRLVEGTLSNMKVQITGYRFSEGFNSKLYKGVQKKLTLLNNRKGLSPEISINKFDVDKSALLREMKAAVDYVESNLRVRIRPDIARPSLTGSESPRGGSSVYGGVSRFGAGMGLGAAAGGLGRGFIPGLGLAFGVSQLNRLNQELIGQNLAATAVFGNQQAGQEQIEWLRNLGNQIGFDYRSQANPYMKMAAAGTTAGMGTEQVQAIFRSMAEYGRVMGLNDEDMKGSMRAVEQMLNKGQVYAEELKMQLGEKFPAAIQLMAEAVAGGDTEKLFEMMEKGEVKSLEALPKFAEILSRQARVGGALTKAMKTSLAEQMRFNNTFNDLVMFFSESGFEEGQAGIFRTMADFFKEMKPLLQGFGEAWNYVGSVIRIPLGLLVDMGRGLETLSRWTGATKGELTALATVFGLLAFPLTRTLTLILGAFAVLEDFTAFLSGRGSLLGQLLGEDSEVTRNNFIQLFETVTTVVTTLWERLSDIFNLLGKNIEGGWVGRLNTTLTQLEEILYRVNLLLGGPTREQIAAESFKRSNPNIANVDSVIKSEKNKGYFEKLFGGSGISQAGKFLYDRTLFGFLDNNLFEGKGMKPFAENLKSVVNPEVMARVPLLPFLMSDDDVKNSYFSQSQISQYNPDSNAGSTTNYYETKIEVDGYNRSPEELADEIYARFQSQMIKPVAEKARSGSQ